MSIFRVQRLSVNDVKDRPKGYYSSYRFYKDEQSFYEGHVSQNCMKPSEFLGQGDHASNAFILKPSRKFIPMTWLIIDKTTNSVCGRLKRKFLGKASWKILDPSSNELGYFKNVHQKMNPVMRFFDFIFGGNLPEGYEIVSNNLVIASIKREEQLEKPKAKQSFLAKLAKQVFVEKDWVVYENQGHEDSIDPRLYFSGLILIELISRDLSA